MYRSWSLIQFCLITDLAQNNDMLRLKLDEIVKVPCLFKYITETTTTSVEFCCTALPGVSSQNNILVFTPYQE